MQELLQTTVKKHFPKLYFNIIQCPRSLKSILTKIWSLLVLSLMADRWKSFLEFLFESF